MGTLERRREMTTGKEGQDCGGEERKGSGRWVGSVREQEQLLREEFLNCLKV